MQTSAPARTSGCASGDAAHTRSGGPTFRLENLAWTPVLIAALVLINLACYYPSLSGYFLADDFVHLAYIFDVFRGNSDVLLRNFVSTWMQAQGIQFYRPFYTLTLAFDYMVGGPNPFVFHVSNLLYHTGACLFLFLLTRRLLREYGKLRSTVAAFFTGAIFAVFPLSAEVISWISARGDGLCAMFYLGAFWLFVRSIQENCRWSLVLSLASCAGSLLSKEMAVTLAATLSLYCLITAPAGARWHQRLGWVVSRTWLFWAVTCGYLVLRTVALGTIAGGYSGSIGEGLSTSIFKRWFLDGSFARVLLPLNAEVFSPRNWLRVMLVGLYGAGAVSLLAGLATRGVTRFALFAAAWFIISMVPTYQVWNLTETLQGSRFIYLGTAPLTLLLVLLVYPLANTGGESNRARRLAALFAACILAGFLACFSAIAYRNNLVWVEAGSQVRALKQEIESAFTRLNANQKVVVFNLPQEHHGAHVLYNGAMLSGLLTPPIARENFAARVVTFEPVLYGDSQLIISSRARRYADRGDEYLFTTFDQASMRLIPVRLAQSIGTTTPDLAGADITFDTTGIKESFAEVHSTSKRSSLAADGLVITNPREPSCVVSPAMNLRSLDVDFVDVNLSCVTKAGAGAAPVILLKWISDGNPSLSSAPGLPMALQPDGKAHRYRFTVSQYKKWVTAGRISHVAFVLLPGQHTVTLHDARLSRGLGAIPALEPVGARLEEDPAGVCRMTSNVAACDYDVSSIREATAATIELSRSNAFFEHYSGEYRDTTLSAKSHKQFHLPSLKGRFELPAGEFPGAGYYQLRAAGLDAGGNVVGYVSDPVNLQVTAGQIAASNGANRGAKARHGR